MNFLFSLNQISFLIYLFQVMTLSFNQAQNSGIILTSFPTLSLEAVAHKSNPLFFLKCLLHPPLPFHFQSSYVFQCFVTSKVKVANRALYTQFLSDATSPKPPADTTTRLIFPKLHLDYSISWLKFSFGVFLFKNSERENSLSILTDGCVWSKHGTAGASQEVNLSVLVSVSKE